MRVSGPSRERPSHGISAVLAAALLLAPSCTHMAPPAPAPSPPAPPVDAVGRYGFLDAADPVGRALTTLWRAQFERHEDPATAAAAFEARAEATAVIEARRERAVALLMPTLITLVPSDSGGYLSLVPLLAPVVDDPEIVAHFRRVLLAPSGPGEEAGEGIVPATGLVRNLAFDQLVAAGRRGSERARESLLEVLERGPAAALDGAVAAYYRISSNRRQAQREMRARLAPGKHYLLYRY